MYGNNISILFNNIIDEIKYLQYQKSLLWKRGENIYTTNQPNSGFCYFKKMKVEEISTGWILSCFKWPTWKAVDYVNVLTMLI